MTAGKIKEKGKMEVKTIAVAVLGAHVDDGGLGDNDGERFDDEIVECQGSLKYLYDEHYDEGGNWDEVRIELVERTHIDRLTAELAALQSRLNETDAENDRLRAGLKRLASHDCGCVPCRGECRTGRAAEIEFEERMQYAADLLENKHEQQ